MLSIQNRIGLGYSDAMGLSGDTSSSIAAAARDHLIAELRQTVDSVAAAVDDAAVKAVEAAQAESARRAEEAAQRIAAVSDEGVARIRSLVDEIVEEAEAIREKLRAAAAHLPSEPDTGREPGATQVEPEAELDEIERARDSIRNAPRGTHVRLRRFRRDAEPLEGVAEGVRIVVSQMRLLGRSEEEIAVRLAEMGVDDPVAVIDRVSS